jgi:hypothetical protein
LALSTARREYDTNTPVAVSGRSLVRSLRLGGWASPVPPSPYASVIYTYDVDVQTIYAKTA